LDVGAVDLTIVIEISLVPGTGAVEVGQKDLEIEAVDLTVEAIVAIQRVLEFDGIGGCIEALAVGGVGVADRRAVVGFRLCGRGGDYAGDCGRSAEISGASGHPLAMRDRSGPHE
jgi:hypothetical protein